MARSSFLDGLKSDVRLKRSENTLEVCMTLGGKEKIICRNISKKLSLIHMANCIIKACAPF